MQTITKALDFAAEKHRDQRRKDKYASPYINHPIDVLNILVQSGINATNILTAAILHDTVEDTDTTLDELVKEFGAEIASLVSEVTDNKALNKIERKKLQITHAASASSGAKCIKIADKLSNLSDLAANPPAKWSPAEIRGYFVWSYCVLEGTRGICAELDQRVNALYIQSAPWVLELSQDSFASELETYYQHIENSN